MGLRAKWVVLLLAVTAEFACAIVPCKSTCRWLHYGLEVVLIVLASVNLCL